MTRPVRRRPQINSNGFFSLSPSHHDTPYRDEARSHRDRPQPPASKAKSKDAPPKQGRSKPKPQRNARGVERDQPAKTPPAKRPSRRRSSGRRGRGTHESALTSHPTGRVAYAETRAWLLAEHGPVCAYCGRRFTASVMTLDHVAPRRGQTAYDRRDNLVLACPGCNMAKRDMAPLAFLLSQRGRAANLLRYGSHLSPMLLELASSLVPDGDRPAISDESAARGWALLEDLDEDESPYRD